MKKIFQYALVIVMCMVGFSSFALERGDRRAPTIPNAHITDGYETSVIKLVYGMNGAISGVQAKKCPKCKLEVYKNTGEAQFYLGRKAISNKQATAYSGKSGTVMYDIKTKNLVRVRFFDLEK